MTGIKPTTVLTLLCLTFPGAAWLRAEDRMLAGLWEVTSTLDGKLSGTQGNACYTPAMVATANQPAKVLQETAEKRSSKQGCTIKEFKVDEHSMTMTKVCPGRTSVIASTYSGGMVFDTVDKVTTSGITQVTHMKGRRVGDCK